MAIVTVLDVPGPPNFAGTLVRSIPTQFNRFWDISGTLKKLFIFVHSVHSGDLGRHFGLPNVRSSSSCPYQSYSTSKSRRSTKFNLKTTVPKLSQFCPNVPILFQKSGFINSTRKSHVPPFGACPGQNNLDLRLSRLCHLFNTLHNSHKIHIYLLCVLKTIWYTS